MANREFPQGRKLLDNVKYDIIDEIAEAQSAASGVAKSVIKRALYCSLRGVGGPMFVYKRPDPMASSTRIRDDVRRYMADITIAQNLSEEVSNQALNIVERSANLDREALNRVYRRPNESYTSTLYGGDVYIPGWEVINRVLPNNVVATLLDSYPVGNGDTIETFINQPRAGIVTSDFNDYADIQVVSKDRLQSYMGGSMEMGLLFYLKIFMTEPGVYNSIRIGALQPFLSVEGVEYLTSSGTWAALSLVSTSRSLSGMTTLVTFADVEGTAGFCIQIRVPVPSPVSNFYGPALLSGQMETSRLLNGITTPVQSKTTGLTYRATIHSAEIMHGRTKRPKTVSIATYRATQKPNYLRHNIKVPQDSAGLYWFSSLCLRAGTQAILLPPPETSANRVRYVYRVPKVTLNAGGVTEVIVPVPLPCAAVTKAYLNMEDASLELTTIAISADDSAVTIDGTATLSITPGDLILLDYTATTGARGWGEADSTAYPYSIDTTFTCVQKIVTTAEISQDKNTIQLTRLDNLGIAIVGKTNEAVPQSAFRGGSAVVALENDPIIDWTAKALSDQEATWLRVYTEDPINQDLTGVTVTSLAGGTMSGINKTAHGFKPGQTVVITGTANHNGTWTLHATTTVDQFVIVDPFVASPIAAGDADSTTTCFEDLTDWDNLENTPVVSEESDPYFVYRPGGIIVIGNYSGGSNVYTDYSYYDWGGEQPYGELTTVPPIDETGTVEINRFKLE